MDVLFSMRNLMRQFIESFSLFVAEKTLNQPMAIHINPIGLYGLGRNNEERLLVFNELLLCIENRGGNILIPTYSYSYTSGEIYDFLHTPSKVDVVSEYLRINNCFKRTYDPMFSYLQFGCFFDARHYVVRDHNSFGQGSLLDELFEADGYIASLGDVLRYWTEIHDSILVVSGPILDNPITSIGYNEVYVPRAYFKALIAYKDNNAMGIGFLLPHEASSKSLYAFVTSIDDLETITGHDFYCNLEEPSLLMIERNDNLKKFIFKEE